MAVDTFKHMSPKLTGVASQHFAITPNDTNVVDPKPRAIYVQAAGTLIIEDEKGVTLSYGVSAGAVLSIRPAKIKVGTTATVYGWV